MDKKRLASSKILLGLYFELCLLSLYFYLCEQKSGRKGIFQSKISEKQAADLVESTLGAAWLSHDQAQEKDSNLFLGITAAEK